MTQTAARLQFPPLSFFLSGSGTDMTRIFRTTFLGFLPLHLSSSRRITHYLPSSSSTTWLPINGRQTLRAQPFQHAPHLGVLSLHPPTVLHAAKSGIRAGGPGIWWCEVDIYKGLWAVVGKEKTEIPVKHRVGSGRRGGVKEADGPLASVGWWVGVRGERAV
jgi:hypothetical protein